MKKQPNIILINCDDLGYGDLGCYGSTRNETPHIDALSDGGLKLTDFYAGSPVCSASRASLMTGCYPPRVGFGKRPVLFPGADTGLNPEETTIAKVFQRAGYATQAIGKWHCGDQPDFLPTNHGFDRYFGIPFSNDMGRQNTPNYPQHRDRPPLPLLRDTNVIQEQPDQRGITERYTDEALQFIHRNQSRPFFLYLAHMYVHVPLFVPQQFLEKSRNGAYGGAVAAIDWSTGVIVDRLKTLGLLEDTLIIFTSDNGSRAQDEGGSNLPLRGHKAQCLEGGQRVPCIFHWPAAIPADTTLSHLTRNADLLPTLAGLAGIDGSTSHTIDGVDLSGHVLGQRTDTLNDTNAYYLGECLAAVRVGPWKRHYATGEAWWSQDPKATNELYNLEDDIGETRNLFEERPDIVAELDQIADALRRDLGDSARKIQGGGCRRAGFKPDAKPLTEYRENAPYMVAMYDLADMPTMAG